jgi:hypothetical protein
MTPKETYTKAVALICEFKINGISYDQAKQCALIAVDEIYNLCWNGNLKAKEYWFEVKQEIQKL